MTVAMAAEEEGSGHEAAAVAAEEAAARLDGPSNRITSTTPCHPPTGVLQELPAPPQTTP